MQLKYFLLSVTLITSFSVFYNNASELRFRIQTNKDKLQLIPSGSPAGTTMNRESVVPPRSSQQITKREGVCLAAFLITTGLVLSGVNAFLNSNTECPLLCSDSSNC